jgi:hypothetical protein
MSTTLQRAAAAALVVALAFLAGCGGSGSDTSATEKWAGGVCDAVNSWQTELKSIGTNLQQGGLTKSDLQASIDKATTATKTLSNDLKQLGKPDTQAGEQAKSELTKLSNELSKNVDAIESAIADASGAAGVLNAVTVTSGALSTMGQQVSATVSQLEKLDAQGELQQAFDKASSCDNLVNS